MVFQRELVYYIAYLGVFFVWSNYYYRTPEYHDPVHLHFDSSFGSRLSENLRKRADYPTYMLLQVILLIFTIYFSYFEVIVLVRLIAEADRIDAVIGKRKPRGIQFYIGKVARGTMAYFFQDLWNWLDTARSWVMIYILVADRASSVEAVATGALLMWIRLLYYGRGFDNTGALVRSFNQTLKEMAAFLLLCTVFWLGFGHCFYLILRYDSFLEVEAGEETFFDALVFCYRLVFLGESDIGAEERKWFMQVLFMASTFISSVVALNMLIAIMTDTYNNVQDSAIVAANSEISQLVYEFETWQRSGIASHDYIVAAFRKERPIPDVQLTTDAGMDAAELRLSQRALDKEDRRRDHMSLVRLDESITEMSDVKPRLDVLFHRVNDLEQLIHKHLDGAEQTYKEVKREVYLLRNSSQAALHGPSSPTHGPPVLPMATHAGTVPRTMLPAATSHVPHSASH